MRSDHLHHQELLNIDAESGMIRFAGQRAILLDAIALGIFRKYLSENFGETAARTVLTQFGFAHGWRMGESLRGEFESKEVQDWLSAGPRLHELEGIFQIYPGSGGPLSKEGLRVVASYEAEQHLEQFGRSQVPVCWTICGLMSGYLSYFAGQEIYVLEDKCTARGDATCHFLGRTRESWGVERAEDLGFFLGPNLRESLDISLQKVTDTLKTTEQNLKRQKRALSRVSPEAVEPSGMVSRSKSMQNLIELARRVAKVDVTLLITGESGTGKERVARLVHDESPRASGPFVAINCGAIAESLLESELFGHARGAFTGAIADRPGLFEAANCGTLLLDEVGEVSPGMQVKLLRALQEREVRRVGENRNRNVDVRVVAATNRDLARGVADGTFRQDLYYRLKVVELAVPPLRDRQDDILPLARTLLANASLRMKRKVGSLSPAVADRLVSYSWPGNVRELENAMERAVAVTRGTRVDLEDLPEEIRLSHAKFQVVSSANSLCLEDIERDHILAVLEMNDGNQTKAARQLKIGTATLYRKLKSYEHLLSDRDAPNGTHRNDS